MTHQKKEQSIESIILKGVLIFAALYGFYLLALKDCGIYLNYLEAIHRMVSFLLNSLGVEHVENFDAIQTKSGHIYTPAWAEVRIDAHVDAMLEICLLLAPTLAWPGSRLAKLFYCLLGVFLGLAIAVSRAVGMLLVDQYAPLYRESASVWFFPSLMIILVLVYFYSWTRISRG